VDAIQLVKKDHRAVEKLFKDFERAEKAERQADMKRAVRGIVRELSVHAVIEEALLYPALRSAAPDLEDDVLEGLEEHHLVKVTLLELDKMSPKQERYAAKVTVLIENVRHHVKEEEAELLPALRKALAPAELRELGERMAKAKKAAPTRPHPAAPDTPPGNLVAGAVASAYDRTRDAVRDVVTPRNEQAPTLH
jgi:hemerythrin-like domain-containing protein